MAASSVTRSAAFSQPMCGIAADRIRSLAHELASSRAAIHGRIGTCLQDLATLSSWLIDVVSLCTGNLDVEGGAMFARPAALGMNTSGRPGIGAGGVLKPRSDQDR